MNAAERVAALREECRRIGENVDQLSDLDLLDRELGRVQAESRRHENAYNSMLQNQVQRDRSAWSAARRAATEDRAAWAGMYLGALVSRSAGHINEVIHRAAELPDGRVPVDLTRALKEAASRAKWQMLGLIGGREQLEEARAQNPTISLVEKQREEILRLRDCINRLGQQLHRKHGSKGTRENGWRCECPGCELIRSMDEPPAEAKEVKAA